MGPFSGVSPAGTITIGIVVGLISTSVQSLGLTLQRKSHMLEDEKGPHEVQRPPYRRRRWQVGMGMFIISNVLGSSIQISTLPLPVLSTLQAAGLVFNSICATLILGEPFTKWSFWGTALVSAGAALIAIFGAIPSPAHSLQELIELLTRWQFIVWMSLQAVIVIAIAVTIEVMNSFKSVSQKPNFRLTRGLAYGFISGTLSAHSLLFAKSAVELILRTIADGTNQFVRWESWMLVFGLVSLALSQLYYLHRGLKLVSTSVLYPLVFCIYNIIAILDGLIYFRQTDLISPLHAGLIALGTLILLLGVLALSWRLSEEQHLPVVGQSSLTPGLGLVQDTEGEDESALESDFLSDDGRNTPVYNTFTPAMETTPLLSTRRKSSQRWDNQIWDVLEDQESPKPSPSQFRSNTMPALNEGSPLLSTRRVATGESVASTSGEGAGFLSGESPRKSSSRRRRKSTGFPGFIARKLPRPKTSPNAGIQEAQGGIWKLKWWRQRDGESSNNTTTELQTDLEAAIPSSSSSQGQGPGWIPRRGGEQQQRSPRTTSNPPPPDNRGGRGRGRGVDDEAV